MKRALGGLIAGLAIAGANAAWAGDETCGALINRADSFGRLSWSERIEAPPAWALDIRCDQDLSCGFSDPEGVRYLIRDGGLADEQLPVGPATPLPWSLKATDSPEGAAAALERQFPGDAVIHAGEEPTVVQMLGNCGVWLEVAFNRDRRVRSVAIRLFV